MKRREFISLLGAVAAWPMAARAQQAAMPVIGLLGADSSDQYADRLGAFRQGLKEAGYIEGQNLAIEYRWANGNNDRLPALAADLAHLHVNAIVALGSTPAALAAKAATATIPVVFFVGADPVRLGLVASLARPGANLTGATTLNEELVTKRMELVHEAIPKATSLALLINPMSPTLAEATVKDAQMAARDLGLGLDILHASSERDFDSVFAALAQRQVGALVITTDALFISRSEQLGALALSHAVPAIFLYSEFVAAGGLLSYGPDLVEVYRLGGSYVGKVLNGAKPADLPVQLPTKFDFAVNLKTAKALGLTVPPSLLATADEVIE